MRKIKFIHCADVHLDMPFTAVGNDRNRSAVRRRDLKLAFKRIVDAAEAEDADLLLICGDLYEHDYVRKSTITFVNDLFEASPHLHVFIMPGNHDPFTVNSYYRNFKWSANVHILTRENPTAAIEDKGVCVYGCGFGNLFDNSSVVYGTAAANPQFINILLFHGTVDMNFNKNVYNPVSSEELASLGMDYIGLGHFHNRLEGLGRNRSIYNPGSPEPLGFDEAGGHGFFVGQITKDESLKSSLHIRFIQSNSKYYRNLEINISGCSTNEQVTDRIEAAVNDGDISSSLFSVTLKGYIDREFKVDCMQIQSHYENRVFFMEINDETVPDYDFDEIAKEPGLRGLFVRKMLSRINGAGSDREKSLMMKSLYYGLEALERGKIEGNYVY